MLRGLIVALVLLLCLPAGAPAAETQPDPFAHLRPMVGKTWRGVGQGENKAVDISRWEWAVGGHAIRITHALEDGSYGGETMVFFDKKSDGLIFHYFTTAGFHTQGTMTAEPGVWSATEKVEGHPTITEVRSTATFNADGTFTTRSEYLDAGTWVPGHSFAYAEAPAGTVPPLPTAK